MRRRDFIKCAGSVVAWPLPLVAHAQQPPMPVIGWLSSGSRETDDVSRLPSFRLGLNETGYTEGRNVAIRISPGRRSDRATAALAADLASRQVSLILAAGSPAAALAAKSVTTSIPIIFNNSSDPVKIRLVASLNRPGGT